VPGALVIQPPDAATTARVQLAAADQIADSASVSVHDNMGTLDLAGFNDTIASLTLQGALVQSGAGTLTLSGTVTCLASASTARLSGILSHTVAATPQLTVPDGAASPDLSVTAIVHSPAGAPLRKLGSGSATFTGFSGSLGEVIAQEGLLTWSKIAPGTCLALNGGTLAGTGTFSQITSSTGGGIITPGTSPGRLIGSNINLNTATTLRMELNGPTAGTGYDQINIEDESTLGGATLELIPGFTPAVGQTFTLIDSTGTGITDTFAGLPEGAVFVRGGLAFQITYHGGSGGDTVLTVVQPADPVITASSIAPGTGGQAGQTVITMTGTGIPAAPYVLEISDDLLVWTPLQSTVASPAGAWSFTDASQPLTPPRLFTRVRLE
jgi:hypothetical protein